MQLQTRQARLYHCAAVLYTSYQGRKVGRVFCEGFPTPFYNDVHEVDWQNERSKLSAQLFCQQIFHVHG